VADPLDIVVIGAPRSASTSISGYLAQHPDVVLSDPKEPHFFDVHYEEGLAAVPDLYFPHRTSERLAAEATPDYLTLPWVPGRIAGDIPNAKLVATLRNPVDRAWSHWWLLYTRGIEDLEFEAAIDANLERLEAGIPLEEGRWQQHVERRTRGLGFEYRLFLDHGYYARNLERYFEVFDRDSIKIIFTHELGADTDGTVRDLYRFIGVDDTIEFDTSRANEAAGAGSRRLMKSARGMGLTRLGPMLPDGVKQRLKTRMANLGGRPTMDDDVRTRLQAHFDGPNRELEALLGVELPAW